MLRAQGNTNPIAMKNVSLIICCFFLFHYFPNAQCLIAPAFPACNGTEPMVVANDNINNGQIKYFYGSAASLSNVKLNGGTLVVCTDLTLNELVFDSGILFIQPSAKLVVSNGAGLVVRGNTSVYNAGTFQCMGNYVMDGTYATASKPNLIINTSAASYLKMPNQYFVINNPYSKLINNGLAEFHGLITDPLAAAGSVCLGFNSQTKMTVLYNKAKHPYIAPTGPACVSVTQYSQLYDTLTVYPDINFCLGSTHVSDASCTPWDCKPNAWGSGQVVNNCTTCSMVLTFLPTGINKLEAKAYAGYNQISWQSGNSQLLFYIQRSLDGVNFFTIDSIKGDNKTQYQVKDYFKESSYYRLYYYQSNQKVSSNVVEVNRLKNLDAAYPNPFKNYLELPLKGKPNNITITDINGRTIHSYKAIINDGNARLYFENIPKGMYLVTVIDQTKNRTYKIIKD